MAKKYVSGYVEGGNLHLLKSVRGDNGKNAVCYYIRVVSNTAYVDSNGITHGNIHFNVIRNDGGHETHIRYDEGEFKVRLTDSGAWQNCVANSSSPTRFNIGAIFSEQNYYRIGSPISIGIGYFIDGRLAAQSQIPIAIQGASGERGEKGETAVYDPNSSETPIFEMATETGNSETKSMTQKAITDAINAVSSNVEMPIGVDESYTSDLEFTDEYGNAVAKFREGHIQTKNFDSASTVTHLDSPFDFAVEDGNGNVLVKIAAGHIKTKNFNSADAKKNIKVLSIGNSYSYDAFSYVPALLEEMGIDVTFGILYTSGCSLEEHYAKIPNDGRYDSFSLYTSSTGVWLNDTVPPIASEVASQFDWDIVVLQQVSLSANDYTSYQPYLNDIIDALSPMFNKGVEFGWLLTPIRANEANPETYWNGQIAAVEKIMNETVVEFVIPCGTAIANARTNSTLNNLGGDSAMTYDGVHLQEGLPCLIEAYTSALTFASLMGCGHKGIMGSKVRPTDEWIIAHNIPGRNGSSVGLTDALCLLGQKCAVTAIKKSDEITTI